MKRLLFVSAILSTLVIAYSCSPGSDENVLIEGRVTDAISGSAISNALVQITAPEEFTDTFGRTDSTGQYSFSGLDISEVTELSITASAPGYEEETRTLPVAPNDEITDFNFELSSEGGDGDGDGDDGDGPSGPSGGAASIQLLTVSEETINIAATGGVVSSTLTFEVQDSSGNSIDLSHAIDVQFTILSGPNGGETITPDVVTTNAQGRVSATLSSGNIAGVVKIEAKIERTVPDLLATAQDEIGKVKNNGKNVSAESQASSSVKGGSNGKEFNATSSYNSSGSASRYKQSFSSRPDLIITSEPVAITIHGGFPDESHFSLTPESYNFEGYSINDLRIPLTVILGDEYSNPVKPGTAVYFSTTGGVIQGSGQGNTDTDGKVTVDLISADPRPSDDIAGSGGRPGYATITARTVDNNDQEIEKSTNILFSTSKASITTPFDRIELSQEDSQPINFSVTDLNGNPMAPGTTIEVTSGETDSVGTVGSVTVSGTTSYVLGDELFPGENITDFNITVTADAEFKGGEYITITVTAPSGAITSKTITIIGSGGGVSGPPAGAASLELISLSNSVINIAESGGINNTSFTFQVQDSAGRNLNSNGSVDVNFTIESGPGGGESISPATVSTDAQGRATSNLKSGNSAGVVQIQAEIVRDDIGLTIRSKPVAITIHGGFPDQNHFSLKPTGNANIEGYDRNGEEIQFEVLLGDEFSNPVKPNTAIYFSTDGGVIEGSSGEAHTDDQGRASVTLISGNPRPANGQGTVTATTVNKDNTEISQTANFIFSTSKALITPEVTQLELAPEESFQVGFTVTDENGNPMAAGTSIDVSTSGAGGVTLTGTTSQTMSDELVPGDGVTNFNFTATAASGFNKSETIIITVTSPSGIVTTNEELVIYGTGGGVSGVPAGAAAIVLETIQHETINIKETGGLVNTSFTFQVQDSSGRPLDLDNPVDVEFEILQGPGGGEGVLPETARTNSTGRVTSNLFSGNTAGVVQVQAKVERPEIGLTIISKPIAITIHGGFPDLDHFSLAPDATAGSYNFEGWSTNGERNRINVLLGDEFSNPVKPGTAVYFSTTGGVIEGSGVGHTDEDGQVSVDLISGDPRPDDPQTVDGVNFGGRDGLATVTARTINGDSQFIEKSINVVFSTSQASISANPTTFDLAPNGGASFSYTVTDLNGNPMAAGTNISIQAGGGIEVTGSSNFTLGNHLFPGPGATEFNFSIRDTDETSNDPSDLTLSIVVTSPSGNRTTYDGISGTRRKVSGTRTSAGRN